MWLHQKLQGIRPQLNRAKAPGSSVKRGNHFILIRGIGAQRVVEIALPVERSYAIAISVNIKMDNGLLGGYLPEKFYSAAGVNTALQTRHGITVCAGA